MNQHCILVVDDDPIVLEILVAAFESLGCNVITAQNGQEALEMCINKRPSLIISDWRMPVLNGIDLFFHIKNIPALQHIPFVFITISDDEETKITLLENGLEDYWDKPLNIKEIIIKTKRILNRLRSSQKITLQSITRVVPEVNKQTLMVSVHPSSLSYPTNLTNPTKIIDDEPSETYLYVNRVLDDRYKLLRPIGRGGMGIVYEVEDLVKGKTLALKLLRREYSSDEVEVCRFYREATTTSQIKHPNVIEIYEYGTVSSGQVFITMEILTGHSLMSELACNTPKKLNYPPMKIMEQICLGVLAAHQQGIIHRDLKPNNIFLLDPPLGESILKVLDFGIALLQPKAEDKKTSERITNPDILIGTPEYMSPEQILKQEIGKESDIYSLGIIFYEILTGQLPFIGNLIEVLCSQTKEKPTPINEIISIDGKPTDLIMSMLEKDPKIRPQLEVVINTLRHYCN
jgi:CheY-like chemotaxis protein/tRNA A-37 threonylcarbamoyl transferase component Bud32